MKKISTSDFKTKYSCFRIILLCFSIFCLFSYVDNGFSNETEGVILKNKLETSHSDFQSNENKMIVQVVQNFWKLSLEGDNNNVAKYIQEAPEEFWESCSSDNGSTINSNSEEYDLGESFPKAEGKGISLSEKKTTFWSLKHFSQQIKTDNLKLLKASVIKFTTNEAIVKIDWNNSDSNQSWVSQYLLLFNSNAKWKIFMITDPIILKRYNKDFALDEKCS